MASETVIETVQNPTIMGNALLVIMWADEAFRSDVERVENLTAALEWGDHSDLTHLQAFLKAEG